MSYEHYIKPGDIVDATVTGRYRVIESDGTGWLRLCTLGWIKVEACRKVESQPEPETPPEPLSPEFAAQLRDFFRGKPIR